MDEVKRRRVEEEMEAMLQQQLPTTKTNPRATELRRFEKAPSSTDERSNGVKKEMKLEKVEEEMESLLGKKVPPPPENGVGAIKREEESHVAVVARTDPQSVSKFHSHDPRCPKCSHRRIEK